MDAMWLLAVLLVMYVIILQTDCRDCMQCSNVRNISDCHYRVLCNAPQNMCSTRASYEGGQLRYSLDCKPRDECPLPVYVPSIVGRSLNNQTKSCHQCCTSNTCNRHLCLPGSESFSTDRPCLDDPTFDCRHIATAFDICKDVHHAKLVCRDFCNLCDLVDGSWATWSSWSQCNVTCGRGQSSRMRTCTHPAPAHGGLNCTGSSQQWQDCFNNIQCPAPIDGAWSTWEAWGACSVTDGGIVGKQTRFRMCDNPAPQHGGKLCRGGYVDTDNRYCG